MKTRLTILVFILALAACGGGGSSVPPDKPTTGETAPETETETEEEVTPEPEPDPAPRAANLPFPLEPWTCDPALAHIAGACGDDGARPHFGIWALPDADRADARRSPITHDSDNNDRRIFVGVDQGTEHVGSLVFIGHRGNADIRFGTLNDGAGQAAVDTYLSQVSPNRTTRSSNSVRVIGASTQEERNRVIAAVRMVNAALPESAKLTVDAERADLSLASGMTGATYFRTGSELQDTIHVEFVSGRDPANRNAAARTFDLHDTAYVVFFQGSNSYRNERESIILLAHEIMHSLGVDGHAYASFPSIMKGTNEIHAVSQGGLRQPMSVLYPVDREALRVLYGTDDPSSFGPWSSVSLHIHGNSPHAGFGVAFRNGYAEPWAYGYLNGYGFNFDRAAPLSGAATWNGELVGFTPDAEAVMGDAAINVNFAVMQGTAAFTELEHWAARQQPGAEGTGTMWGDGDLRYAIEVVGGDYDTPTFRETGGDAGRLTGIFTGLDHKGAAGTLERTDLTAAFGAERQ